MNKSFVCFDWLPYGRPILPNFFPNIVPAKMGMMLVYIKLIVAYHIMISIQQKILQVT